MCSVHFVILSKTDAPMVVPLVSKVWVEAGVYCRHGSISVLAVLDSMVGRDGKKQDSLVHIAIVVVAVVYMLAMCQSGCLVLPLLLLMLPLWCNLRLVVEVLISLPLRAVFSNLVHRYSSL